MWGFGRAGSSAASVVRGARLRLCIYARGQCEELRLSSVTCPQTTLTTTCARLPTRIDRASVCCQHAHRARCLVLIRMAHRGERQCALCAERCRVASSGCDSRRNRLQTAATGTSTSANSHACGARASQSRRQRRSASLAARKSKGQRQQTIDTRQRRLTLASCAGSTRPTGLDQLRVHGYVVCTPAALSHSSNRCVRAPSRLRRS